MSKTINLKPHFRRDLIQSSILFYMHSPFTVQYTILMSLHYTVSCRRNLGLEVECDGCADGRVRLVTTQTGSSSFSPVLNILLTEREAYPRNPRAMLGEAVHYDDALGSDCRKGPNQGRCCRHSLEVVFKVRNLLLRRYNNISTTVSHGRRKYLNKLLTCFVLIFHGK